VCAVPLYVVERVIPGATLQSLGEMRHAAEEACGAFTAEGRSVRYLRSIFTPGESRCQCLFEAASADLVQAANDTAQIPYSRIVVAMELGVNE
jgi:Protein of unknown function (DUF4242)